MPIERLWKTGQYQSWLATLHTKPSAGVHRALVRWTDGKVRDSHLKIIYADGRPHRHLIHEAAGWLAAKALKLPIPAFAGFIGLSAEQVERAHPDRAAGAAVAWVTSTAPSKSMVITPGMEMDEALTKELQKWPSVAAACAFDEWVANVDRYPRNLLRIGLQDYMLIDHDFIAGGPHWLPDLLTDSVEDDFRNVLRDRCCPDARNVIAEKGFSNAMVMHSERFPAAFDAAEAELMEWLNILEPDADARESLQGFLSARSCSAKEKIKQRYRIVV